VELRFFVNELLRLTQS